MTLGKSRQECEFGQFLGFTFLDLSISSLSSDSHTSRCSPTPSRRSCQFAQRKTPLFAAQSQFDISSLFRNINFIVLLRIAGQDPSKPSRCSTEDSTVALSVQEVLDVRQTHQIEFYLSDSFIPYIYLLILSPFDFSTHLENRSRLLVYSGPTL